MRKEEVIERIQSAFGANSYPGDGFLQGSFQGCEPAEEAGAFMGKRDWRGLDSKMLDEHYNALSFFSEAGFRFFLPAYLIADVREELLTADPLFHLCHGFASVSVEIPVGSQTFSRGTGGTKLLNPQALRGNDVERLCAASLIDIHAGGVASHRGVHGLQTRTRDGES